MRSRSLALVSLLLVACGPSQEPPPEVPAAPPPPTLADFAGAWENIARLEDVEAPVTSTTRGGASGTDWVMELEGRPAVPLQVTMQGDSLVTESAEYESILRPGVTTIVRTAAVLRDGRMEGAILVTYRTPAGEEQLRGTLESRRMP